MMDSFLKEAAEIVFKKHELSDLKNIQIILPSRRAVYFFKHEIAALSEKPFIAPQILSIDDFIIKLSRLEVLDSINLYFEIFELFLEFDSTLTFEKFMTWAQIIVKDFENIDQALVENPHLLFRYMSEAQAIERWELESDFDFSTTSLNYFDFFVKVSQVYEKLKFKLLKNNKCYKGMAYRKVAEEITFLLEDFPFSFFYFIGLNALSNAEEQIIGQMVKLNVADCIWDTDNYYINSENKAGKKLRNYKFSKKFGSWSIQSNLLKTSKKDIKVFCVQNETLQTDIISNLILESNQKSHVIVVLNENQFKPLLLNIPKVSNDFNVTVGLPITNSDFFSLLNLFFEIQINSSLESDKTLNIHNKLFFKLIEHPQINKLLTFEWGEKKLHSLKNELKKENVVFVKQKKILVKGLNIGFLDLFFLDFKDKLNLIFQKLRNLASQIINILSVHNDELEFAFISILLNKLNLLEDIFLKHKEINFISFRSLLLDVLKTEKVPFTGETTAKVQIMSMLETRCLDFEHVSILSFNEGNLPSNQKNKSFIPFDAAEIFKMPLYSDQDAIMAYHFYRLLQRASFVNFLYLQPGAEGLGSKEKSRFITQVEEELSKYNENLTLSYLDIQFSGKIIGQNDEISILKTDELLKKISFFLKNKGFSSSSLNDYLDCGLKFYWNRIEKIKKIEEISDNMGSDVFGNMVHYTLEELDKILVIDKTTITKETLQDLKVKIPDILGMVIKDKFSGFETSTGLNSVLKEIALKILIDFFQSQIVNFKESFSVLATEKQFEHVLTLNIDEKDIDVKLVGIADRLELHQNKLMIIDYKTGKVVAKELNFSKDDIEDLLKNSEKKKLRQLLIYRYLVMNNLESNPLFSSIFKPNLAIVPKIYSFRNIHEVLELNIEQLSNDLNRHVIENLLFDVVSDLLNKKIPFTKTENRKVCEFCDFNSVCKRSVKN